jgi:putative two-component system response regulator
MEYLINLRRKLMLDDTRILAVDDDNFNLQIIKAILEGISATIYTATNGQEALDLLESTPGIDIVLLDLQMPVMDGFEALQRIKLNVSLMNIPVIVVTADQQEVNKVLALGANDFLAKPFNPDELRLRVMNHIRSKKYQDIINDMNAVLEKEVAKKTAALQEALFLSQEAEYEICLRLGRAAEFRDMETGMHTRRISEMSKVLALLAGLSQEESELLRFASPLHDVGKIGIPDRILLKPGKLDTNEMQIMKLHTTIGGRILSEGQRFPSLEAGCIVALQHHEKWDGSGYPHGLQGKDIHIFARIVMITDIFDALASDRPYKKALPIEKTLAIMEEGRNTFFDPSLLQLFLSNLQQFIDIRDYLKDQQEVESDPLLELLSIT